MQIAKCSCITLKGASCKNKAKFGSDKCTTHLKKCPPIMERDTNKFSGVILRKNEPKRYTDKIEFNVIALREMQQKRVMSNTGVKSYKNSCKLSIGSYNCPECNQHVNKLECAHIGAKIIVGIRKIVTEHGERLNWDTFELFVLVKDMEDKSWLTICCTVCNKNFEED